MNQSGDVSKIGSLSSSQVSSHSNDEALMEDSIAIDTSDNVSFRPRDSVLPGCVRGKLADVIISQGPLEKAFFDKRAGPFLYWIEKALDTKSDGFFAVFLGSSLCRQRTTTGRYGQLGVSYRHQTKGDIIFFQKMCKILGIGCSESSDILRDGEDLLNENTMKKYCDDTFEVEEEEEEDALTRARVIIAERMIQTGNERERNEGLKIIDASAKRHNPHGMLALGLVYEYGLNGIGKDKNRARVLYEELAKMKNLEALARLATLGSTDDMKPENETIWGALLHRVSSNTLLDSVLNLKRHKK